MAPRVNQSTGATTEGNNAPNVSANYINPTDFKVMEITKQTPADICWSGYDTTGTIQFCLENVDLTDLTEHSCR